MKLTGPKQTIKRARALRGAMSHPERVLWQVLRKNQTGLRFRRQHPAGPYVLDFYCDATKLCVEVDGAGHDFTQERDAVRDRWLGRQGVRTLRIPARHIGEDLEAMVRMIVAAGQAPSVGLRPPPPPEGEDEDAAQSPPPGKVAARQR